MPPVNVYVSQWGVVDLRITAGGITSEAELLEYLEHLHECGVKVPEVGITGACLREVMEPKVSELDDEDAALEEHY